MTREGGLAGRKLNIQTLTRRINTRKEIHMKVNTELLQKKIKDSGLKMGFHR